MKGRLLRAACFLVIGLLIYAGIFAMAEHLVYRYGRSNPLYKIAVLERREVDWVILGASHAMPLAFADINEMLEGETGLRIVNLAAPGAGPLYNRFVLEQFLTRHRARNLLYAIDSFAFYSRQWNEERFADAKLLRRTPLRWSTVVNLGNYVRDHEVDPRALADYLTGFTKVNNRERFQPDVWEGEAQFERTYRPSATALASRISYLYPQQVDATAASRYLEQFEALIALARRQGSNVTVVKLPVPSQFQSKLPSEDLFDEKMRALLAPLGTRYLGFEKSMPESRWYFDTDHLNRNGVREFIARDLKPLLLSGS